jgi:Fe-S-cluster containining protein
MLKEVPELSEYDRGNGMCRYLTENNLCMIYSNRPVICNVEKMYDLYFKDIFLPKDYIIRNLKACVKLANYAKNNSAHDKLQNILTQIKIVGQIE